MSSFFLLSSQENAHQNLFKVLNKFYFKPEVDWMSFKNTVKHLDNLRSKINPANYIEILKSKTRVSSNLTCFHRALIRVLLGERVQQEGYREFTNLLCPQIVPK